MTSRRINGYYCFFDYDYPNDWYGVGDADIEDLSDDVLIELLREVTDELERRNKEK